MDYNREFIHYGSDKFDKDHIYKIKDYPISVNKPPFGLWATPVDVKFGWKDWCESEDYNTDRLNKSFRFKIKEGSKIAYVGDIKDMTKYPATYLDPIIDKYMLRMDWNYDWDIICKEYDAFFLDLDLYSIHYLFNAYDVKSIVVFNNDIVIPL